MMDKEQTLSVVQAGAALGVSSRTARRWCKEGKLTAKKSGKSYLIGLDAVEQMRRSIKGKSAHMQERETATDGRITESTEEGASSFTEAMGDRPENGQAVEPVAEKEDTGQMIGQIQEKISERVGQLEQRLQKEIDRIDRTGERIFSLENYYSTLINRFTSFRDIAILVSFFVVMLGIMVVGLGFFIHQFRYEHHRVQQAEEQVVDEVQDGE